MPKHLTLVALAAAVSDLLALGPVPNDPDGPQAVLDEAVMDEVVARSALCPLKACGRSTEPA